jgi:hypothetical protein
LLTWVFKLPTFAKRSLMSLSMPFSFSFMSRTCRTPRHPSI